MTFEEDLEAAAHEELERACTLGWAQLAGTPPGATPSRASRPAAAASVLSAATCGEGEQGGDIRVEITVYEPRSYEEGVRLSRSIRRETV